MGQGKPASGNLFRSLNCPGEADDVPGTSQGALKGLGAVTAKRCRIGGRYLVLHLEEGFVAAVLE